MARTSWPRTNWPGVIPLLERGMQYGDMWRDLLSRYLQSMDCPTCHGARLRPESLAVRVDDLNIHQFCSLPVERALRWLNGREFDGATPSSPSRSSKN